MHPNLTEKTLPENKGTELADFLGNLWEDIFDKGETDKIPMYNQGAKIYNDDVEFTALQLITDYKKQLKVHKFSNNKNSEQMATKKKAVTKKAAPKKAATKKAGGKESLKEIIVRLNKEGLNVDEIVAKTKIKKTNVQWYFSKLGLKNVKR